jgi:hypothetical protein
MKTKYLYIAAGLALGSICFSCNDFLDRQPLSNITPEVFLTEESQLAAYAIERYGVIPTHAIGQTIPARDNRSDNQTLNSADSRYVPGQWKVGQSGGDWSFTDIFQCNYFLSTVLPRYEEGSLSGSADNIKHYIGEVYFLRAFNYFNKLMQLGDFPIVETVLPDEMEALRAASKRAPHNEVARFILADLDKAIEMMKDDSPDGNRNRLSKMCAQIFKSRVALYEGTWLKNFKGTAFVPGGPNWPGAEKDYNAEFQYEGGSIDNEINWFLDQAIASAAIVAEATPLTANNGGIQQSTTDPVNAYFNMFGDIDLKSYDEVLLWRKYDRGLGIVNNLAVDSGKSSVALTRGVIESFLMANGLPIYADGSGYHGDDYIADVRRDRDSRLQIFVKEPDQINILYPSPDGTHATPVEPIPDIINRGGNTHYFTGYALRKGLSYDAALCASMQGYTASIVFRGAEAYLNYIEAYYERHGSLDANADRYWKAIRTRAGVDSDYNKTIAATDMSEEALRDWGAYTAGQLVDPTLYNIRRERRCEFMGEGMRDADLRRWRAMDQMITTPFHIEGFKLWGPMSEWYADISSLLTYGIGDASTVSDPALGQYLRVHQKTTTSLAYNGYRWAMAHYWSPVAISHFLIASETSDVANSPLYQNPGWPAEANGTPVY